MPRWTPKDPANPMPYDLMDAGRWTRSAMPPDTADELLRRMDWTQQPDGTIISPDGTMRMRRENLKRTDVL